MMLFNLWSCFIAGLGCPSVGKVLKRMTQGGTTPRSLPTDRHPNPLQALREEIEERLKKNRRAVRLRLLPSESEHRA